MLHGGRPLLQQSQCNIVRTLEIYKPRHGIFQIFFSIIEFLSAPTRAICSNFETSWRLTTNGKQFPTDLGSG